MRVGVLRTDDTGGGPEQGGFVQRAVRDRVPVVTCRGLAAAGQGHVRCGRISQATVCPAGSPARVTEGRVFTGGRRGTPCVGGFPP